MYYFKNQQRFKVILKQAIKIKGFTVKQFVIEELNMTMNGYYYSLKYGSFKVKTIFEICEILEIHPASLFLHEDDIYSWNDLLVKYEECKKENK